MPRPNVILFTAHDLGDFLSTYGHPTPTPSFERFAREGIVCERHFSQGTVCSPSRGSIVTGCYPHTNGLMGLVHRGWALDVSRRPALPSLLRAHGYRTHLFGFQHEHSDAASLGYQEQHAAANHHADRVVDELRAWLRGRGRSGTDGPFFIGVGTSETHRIGMNPSGFKHELYEPVDRDRVLVPPWMPDIPEIREDLADFYGCVAFLDRQFGRLLDALDETGLSERTIVLFTTDHGASFLHGKGSVYDGGVKVALQMRAPGLLPAGRRVGALTAHVDVLPTLFDLLELPLPAGIEGRSFAAQARGEGGGLRFVFGEKNYTNYYDPTRWVRTSRFKYIRKGLCTNVFDFVIPELELQRADFRRLRSVWDFYSPRRHTEELYDLETDPGERRNLIEDASRSPQLAELRAALDRHLEATKDPFRFLRNDLPLPRDTYEAVRNYQSEG
jgi:N-sulfoglucosamine sulfohydrolase